MQRSHRAVMAMHDLRLIYQFDFKDRRQQPPIVINELIINFITPFYPLNWFDIKEYKNRFNFAFVCPPILDI